MRMGEAYDFSKFLRRRSRRSARDDRRASRRGGKRTRASHLYAACTNEGSVLVALCAERDPNQRDLNSLF